MLQIRLLLLHWSSITHYLYMSLMPFKNMLQFWCPGQAETLPDEQGAAMVLKPHARYNSLLLIPCKMLSA